MLFCNANGFCASVYRRILEPLTKKYDVYALDLRGHGRTTLPADPSRHTGWRVYADDIGRFLDQARTEFPTVSVDRGWTLAGHSMGGVAAMMAAADRADVAGVRMIEPVILPAATAALARTPFWRLVAKKISPSKKAASRRRVWPSREAVVERYREKALFRRWKPGFLEDYLADGLRLEENGEWALACDPAWEAANFEAHAHSIWPAARIWGPQTKVLVAGIGSTALASARRRLKVLGAELFTIADASHLLPMERPDAAIAFLLDAPPYGADDQFGRASIRRAIAALGGRVSFC